MSTQGAFKRRCIIKKLDFENSIISNVKTNSRNRRKFRARVTHEIEKEKEQRRGELSTGSSSPQAGSPVLTIKKTRGNESQVHPNKRKLNFGELSGSSIDEIPSSQTSPVFKLKTSGISSQRRHEVFSQGNSSAGGSHYQIEDFSQDSKQSGMETSSLGSGNAKIKTPENYAKSDSHANVTSLDVGHDDWLELLEKLNDKRPIRKRYKKNSLLGRLEKLLKKQASDKLIWQHEKRNKVVSKSEKLTVVRSWSEESKFFFLKCRTLTPEPEINFLVVDSRWAPNVRKAEIGSVIHLHTPWQKITVEKPPVTVFVNVICVEILNDVIEATPEDIELESIPSEAFDFNPPTFIESLLASNVSSYLY